MTETHELWINPNGDTTVLPPGELTDLSATKTHTGLSSWSGSLPSDYSLEDLASSEIWLVDKNELVFRGYLETINNTVTSGDINADISGHGLGKDLTRNSNTYTFSNILAAEAIETIWGDTSFNASVTYPSANTSTTDYEAQNISSQSEFEAALDIADTTPLYIENGDLKFAQTCFTSGNDGPYFWDRNGTALVTNEDGYNDGKYEAFRNVGEWIEFQFETDYAIPGEDFFIEMWGNATLAGEDVEITVTVDGEGIFDPPHTMSDTLEWDFVGRYAGTQENTTLDPGTHTIRFECTDIGPNVEGRLSVATFLDDRFSYNRDETLSSTQGYLDGPEWFPQAGSQIAFSAAGAPWTVTEITASGTFNEVAQGSSQSIGARIDGGTWTDASNSASVTATPEASFSEVGPGVQSRVNLGGYPYGQGARNTTPRFGYNGQTLSDLTINIDGDDRPSIGDQEFSGAYFDILQRIHTDNDMRFHIEHEKNSKPAFSYRVGDETRTPPSYKLISETRTLDLKDYHNKVRVRGARVNDARIIREIENQDGINQYGEELQSYEKPGLESEADVLIFARQQLNKGLRNEERTGELEFSPPIAFPAGVSIPVTWSDGLETTPAVEEVSYSVGKDELIGTIQLNIDPIALEQTQSSLRGGLGNLSEGF